MPAVASTPTAVAVAVVAGTIWIGWRAWENSRRKPQPPANPFGLPGPQATDLELGNLGEMSAAGGVLPYTLQLHSDYGSDLVVFWWGTVPVVSVGSAKLLRKLMAETERPTMFFAAFEPLIGKTSIQFANGAEWAERRTIYNHRFARKGVEKREETLADSRDWLLRECTAVVEKGDGTRMLRNLMFDVALRGIANFAYGDLFKDEKEIQALLGAYDASLRVTTEYLMYGKTPPPADKKAFDDSMAQYRRSAKMAIARRKELRDDGDVETILIDEMAARLDEDTLVNEFITFLIAGFHTTGNALLWMVYHLAENPTYQTKIVQELAVGRGADVTLEITDKSPTLDQVFNETLRLEALGSFGARSNPSGRVTIDGHAFPPGTNFLLAIGAATKASPEFQDATQWVPERFEIANGESRNPYMIPFGIGKRRCPGMDYAVSVSKLLVAALLADFSVSLKPGTKVERNLSFVPTPMEDFPIVLAKRKK